MNEEDEKLPESPFDATANEPVREESPAPAAEPVAEPPKETPRIEATLPPPQKALPLPPPVPTSTATRKDIHLGRRLVHMANGSVVATVYALFFEHASIVHLFGTIACVVYILDRIRMHYPGVQEAMPILYGSLFRAEEQFRESAMTPYAIALLLTMITFPKPVALVAIYTLAIADPLSAIVGITWGRRRIVPEKTVEGSLAFWAAAAIVAVVVLGQWAGPEWTSLAIVGLLIGAMGAVFEMLPIRLDDNLTIPLFVGFSAWLVCGLAGVPLG